MEREVATQALDRPHKALRAKPELVCVCGRELEDELHSRQARELAADTSTPMLVTEKGS